ncbi:MAG: ABC transporter ATP-binding protein [Halieaceae bacterium]|nr:ABC transporter ATP-binding protein [Halieaceae bacterium]
MSLLRAESVSFSFAENPVLQAVNLSVAPGEVLGLIGPNGAGKTTLLRILAGLLDAQQGAVLMDGAPLQTLPEKKRAQQIGYLPQGAPAHWPLTVERVVELGRIPHRPWWAGLADKDRACIEAAMELTDVRHLRQRIVTELSGGERTRVMLARVLAAQPRLLLADEPVAALDPHHQLQVMRTLAQVAAQGSAMVVVLHDLGLAARFCTRLLALDAGNVIADGPTLDVLRSDTLAAAYQLRIEVSKDAEGAWVRYRDA